MSTETSPPEAVDPFAASRELYERAQEAMLGMFRIEPSADPSRTVASVTEKVVESQRRAFDLMNGMADVWKRLAEQGGGHETWRQVLDETTKMMSQAQGGQDPREMFDAWRRQGEQLFGATGPGAEMFRAFSPGAEAPSMEGVTAFLSSPGFGLTREYQNRVGRVFETWLELQQREMAYRGALGTAWTEAFRKMTERMAAMTREGQRFEQPRELLDAWVKTADEVFTQHFHTERFSQIQSEMLNASHRLRKERRALSEELLQAQDLPTRSDLEEAHRMIYELRKEVRALGRELRASREKTS